MTIALSLNNSAKLSVSTSRAQLLAVVLALGSFVWFGIDAAQSRGPWLDEFWTLWFSQHDVSIRDVLVQRWLADLHPPLFSFAHWLIDPWAGDSYVRHRMLNLVPLAWVGLFSVLAISRYPKSSTAICLFLIVWLSLPTSLEYFAEMRSYFTQMALTIVIAGAVMVVMDAEEDWHSQRDLPLAAILATSIFAIFNLNYLAAVVAGLVLLVALPCLSAAGKPIWARIVILSVVVSSIPVAAFVLLQQNTLSTASSGYWVTGTFWDAVGTLRRTIRRAAQANDLVLLGAGAVIALTALQWAWSRIRGTRLSSGLAIDAPNWRSVSILAVAVLGFAVILLGAQLHHPVVTGRYLLTWQILVVGALALLASPIASRHYVWLVLPLIVAGAHQAVTAQTVKSEMRWKSSLGLLQSAVAACRESKVLAAEFPRPSFMRNETEVRRWGHEHMAAWYGIQAKFVELKSDTLPSKSNGHGACPTLVWVEHANWTVLPRTSSPGAMARYVGVDSGAFDLDRATVEVGDTGFVLMLPTKP